MVFGGAIDIPEKLRELRRFIKGQPVKSQKRDEIASLTMKIAVEQSRSTACSSATATETRSTSPQLKNIRPNYFVSLPIKNENIKGAIQIFEEFYKKNDPRNASGLTGYQKVQT